MTSGLFPVASLASNLVHATEAERTAVALNVDNANDLFTYLIQPLRLAERPILKQSVFVFGGMTSGSDIWSTTALNLNRSGQKNYDNYIVGAAYQRDLIQLNN